LTFQNQYNKSNNIQIPKHVIITINNNQTINKKTNPTNNIDFQSNMKSIIIDLPFNVIIFQTIK